MKKTYGEHARRITRERNALRFFVALHDQLSLLRHFTAFVYSVKVEVDISCDELVASPNNLCPLNIFAAVHHDLFLWHFPAFVYSFWPIGEVYHQLYQKSHLTTAVYSVKVKVDESWGELVASP